MNLKTQSNKFVSCKWPLRQMKMSVKWGQRKSVMCTNDLHKFKCNEQQNQTGLVHVSMGLKWQHWQAEMSLKGGQREVHCIQKEYEIKLILNEF